MSRLNDPALVLRNVRRTRPYSQRRDAPETHKKHLSYLGNISAARINREQSRALARRCVQNPSVTEAQYQAVRSSFLLRLPYLAPENILPASTTVKSLLAESVLDQARVRYGVASVNLKDAPLFEALQLELASINEQIAARQLYQLMHGHLPTHIFFSEIGYSAAIPNVEGRNLIHVNTRYTVLDPLSCVVTPLCLVLGHEIEHANVPAAVSLSLRSLPDQGFTTAEEVRAIDGYENRMLDSLGRGERSTHRSFIVTLDPDDHTKIMFPYTTKRGRSRISPGQRVQGRLIDANIETVKIALADGDWASFDTRLLIAATSGMQRRHRMNSFGRHIASQMPGSASASAPGHNGDSSFLPEHVPFVLMEQKTLASPAVVGQIADWRAGAARGEYLTISMNGYGLLHLHKERREIDPMQYLILSKAYPRDQERPPRRKRKPFVAGSRTLIDLAILAKACTALEESDESALDEQNGLCLVGRDRQDADEGPYVAYLPAWKSRRGA
jgi:hypothetical protein